MKILTLRTSQPCATCIGKGQVKHMLCPACLGTGSNLLQKAIERTTQTTKARPCSL